jgi:hypothetical protein
MEMAQFSIRTIMLVLLCCTSAIASDRFLSSGERLSEAEADGRTAEARTIDEWLAQVFRARSREFRNTAALAIKAVASRHTPTSPLPDDEVADCREAAKKLLAIRAPATNASAFSEYRELRKVGVAILVRTADKSCVPIFTGLIKSHNIYEPALMGPAFEGLERCGPEGRTALEVLAKSRNSTVRELASRSLDRLDSADAAEAKR